jgi:hypothetical protein
MNRDELIQFVGVIEAFILGWLLRGRANRRAIFRT